MLGMTETFPRVVGSFVSADAEPGSPNSSLYFLCGAWPHLVQFLSLSGSRGVSCVQVPTCCSGATRDFGSVLFLLSWLFSSDLPSLTDSLSVPSLSPVSFRPLSSVVFFEFPYVRVDNHHVRRTVLL